MNHHVYLYRQPEPSGQPWVVQWEVSGWDDEGKRVDMFLLHTFFSWGSSVRFLRAKGW